MIENIDDIRIGLVVERDGEQFEVTESGGIWTKSPSDANWFEGIEYISLSAGDDKTYIRRLDDFMRKFSIVEENEE